MKCNSNFPEDQEFETNESKKIVTENGFPAVEDSPLLNSKETLISLDYVQLERKLLKFNVVFQGTCSPVSPAKKDINNKDIRDANSLNDDSDDDEESMDWWTKYFASLDKMIMVKRYAYFYIFSYFFERMKKQIEQKVSQIGKK